MEEEAKFRPPTPPILPPIPAFIDDDDAVDIDVEEDGMELMPTPLLIAPIDATTADAADDADTDGAFDEGV